MGNNLYKTFDIMNLSDTLETDVEEQEEQFRAKSIMGFYFLLYHVFHKAFLKDIDYIL